MHILKNMHGCYYDVEEEKESCGWNWSMH